MKATDEQKDMFVKYSGMIELRDAYVKRPFSYKKARKAAIEAKKLELIFWNSIRELYPETKREILIYDYIINEVIIKEKP